MINIRSKITKKLLGYFLLNPRAQNYVNELARNLEVDLGNLARKLKELEAEGIVASELRGNQRYYFLNKNYPLLPEVKRFFEVKYGLPEELKHRLGQLKGVEEAYIYGSYATKGHLSFESDIDILIVGSHSSLEARRLTSDLDNHYGREFNIVDMTPTEFARRKKKRDEFVNRVLGGKTIRIL